MTKRDDSPSSRAKAYERSLELHDAIEALYPRIEEHRVYFRTVMPVDSSLPRPPGRTGGVRHDPMICALAIKAATTKRAVRTLCELGDGQNAIVLTRVLLENACLLEWLIRGEGRRRLDAYGMFLSVQHERIAAMIARYKPRFSAAGATTDVKSDPYHRAVWEHVFRDVKKNRPTRSLRPTWELDAETRQLEPVSVHSLFVEIVADARSYEHDVLYGALGSEIVHSGPFSLLSIQGAMGARDTFILEPMHRDEECTVALGVSNMAMVLALESLTEHMGIDLSAELAKFKTQANADDQEPAP